MKNVLLALIPFIIGWKDRNNGLMASVLWSNDCLYSFIMFEDMLQVSLMFKRLIKNTFVRNWPINDEERDLKLEFSDLNWHTFADIMESCSAVSCRNHSLWLEQCYNQSQLVCNWLVQDIDLHAAINHDIHSFDSVVRFNHNRNLKNSSCIKDFLLWVVQLTDKIMSNVINLIINVIDNWLSFVIKVMSS